MLRAPMSYFPSPIDVPCCPVRVSTPQMEEMLRDQVQRLEAAHHKELEDQKRCVWDL